MYTSNFLTKSSSKRPTPINIFSQRYSPSSPTSPTSSPLSPIDSVLRPPPSAHIPSPPPTSPRPSRSTELQLTSSFSTGSSTVSNQPTPSTPLDPPPRSPTFWRSQTQQSKTTQRPVKQTKIPPFFRDSLSNSELPSPPSEAQKFDSPQLSPPLSPFFRKPCAELNPDRFGFTSSEAFTTKEVGKEFQIGTN